MCVSDKFWENFPKSTSRSHSSLFFLSLSIYGMLPVMIRPKQQMEINRDINRHFLLKRWDIYRSTFRKVFSKLIRYTSSSHYLMNTYSWNAQKNIRKSTNFEIRRYISLGKERYIFLLFNIHKCISIINPFPRVVIDLCVSWLLFSLVGSTFPTGLWKLLRIIIFLLFFSNKISTHFNIE